MCPCAAVRACALLLTVPCCCHSHCTQGAASSDHTTLLLNCFTKLKDVAKLDAFIQGDGSMTRDSLHFDVDTAIKVW
jgi:hypothetical protein